MIQLLAASLDMNVFSLEVTDIYVPVFILQQRTIPIMKRDFQRKIELFVLPELKIFKF